MHQSVRMRAHWHNLVNTVELVLPPANPSPRPKRQIARYSHFAHLIAAWRRACPAMSRPLIIAPSGSGPHLIHASLGLSEFITQTASRDDNVVQVKANRPVISTPENTFCWDVDWLWPRRRHVHVFLYIFITLRLNAKTSIVSITSGVTGDSNPLMTSANTSAIL